MYIKSNNDLACADLNPPKSRSIYYTNKIIYHAKFFFFFNIHQFVYNFGTGVFEYTYYSFNKPQLHDLKWLQGTFNSKIYIASCEMPFKIYIIQKYKLNISNENELNE